MFLFKASGHTYKQVVDQSKHAFLNSPVDYELDEFVLLSKNKGDCGTYERQIQHVAKLLEVRHPTQGELDAAFPGQSAGRRWGYVMQLYWVRPLTWPFNLAMAGINPKRYATVQAFAKLDEADEIAVCRYLCKTNDQVMLEFVNKAVRPDEAAIVALEVD